MSHGTFINPYTFVPFPEVDADTFRRVPAGHDRMGTADDGSPRLMGTIRMVLHARSPIMVRNTGPGFPQRWVPEFNTDVPFLPGSGLAGAIRAMHELVAGGCLRMFHGDFLPTYRDEVRSRGGGDGWHLAQVKKVDVMHGRPSVLRLCSQMVRIRADVLAEALGGAENVVTGTRIGIPNPSKPKPAPNKKGSKNRRDGQGTQSPKPLPAVTEAKDITTEGNWVLLVTDTAARSRPQGGSGNGQQKQTCYWVVGQVAGDILEWEKGEKWEKDARAAWDRYLACVDDTADAVTSPAGGGPERVGVHRLDKNGEQGELIGYRHRVSRQSHPDQVLWVKQPKSGTNRVEEFAAATMWRHAGAYPASERVPEVLLPCPRSDEPDHASGGLDPLCPTCRILGSVDEEQSNRPHAQQRAYRGHVRFSDGIPRQAEPKIQRGWRMPVGRPRPGAGQFYLDTPGDPQPQEGEHALREWGSRADEPAPRGLRGRKRYWLTGASAKRPLFRLTTTQDFTGNAVVEGEAVAEGTEFDVTVSFENLTRAELGGLLCALDPSLVLAAELDGGGEIGMSVGGGRPYGFGTCTATVTDLRARTARDWYLEQGADGTTVDDAVRAFADTVDPGVRDTWPALAAALHLDHVPPEEVYYPTEKPIPAGTLNIDDLDPGFDFWSESRGYQYEAKKAEEGRKVPLTSLKHITDSDQHMPLLKAPQKSKTKPRDSGRDTGTPRRHGREGR